MTTHSIPAAGETLSPAPGPRRKRSRRAGSPWEPWLYLLPAVAVLGALLIYPLYQLIVISLYDYRQAQVSGNAPLTFIGIENYTKLFSDPKFWQVLQNTVGFAAVLVVVTILVGGGLAVLATRLKPWVRNVMFFAALGAWATPAMTGSAVWMFLFDPTLGLVNKLLVGLGLEQFFGHSWTYDKFSAFALVGAEVVWCSFPFVMVTLYAGIIGVPTEVIEAARLDGASTWQLVWQVIVPLLRPMIIVVTIQSIIWDFKLFTQIYVMTSGGGINGQNLVLNVYSYQQAFASSMYGQGAAIGVVMTLLLLLITMVYLRVQQRSGDFI
ncbi:carbohydrate ABC transporter permease [Tessaracoccus caeni]|uniref:carbohydrate ABC transporter permease n=1 Tax=Tessaracoccus caeni TaxID=3031239 RepID=UPI0023D988BF|nr:sugar ABC transporter permease [Tessaracoccus caeni]MDF1488246.1 sugar ABC transporter permease [Tessaracoccus caeni]